MEKKLEKITVVGIGGVGGLLAGVLARHCGETLSVVARGARGGAIREKGLVIHSEALGEFSARPGRVAETPQELPVQDLVLVCVKNGQLVQAARQIAPIVGRETVVVPVMNGVTAESVLRRELEQGIVLQSVIYTVSSAGRDFSITQTGNFTQLWVGAAADDAAGAAAAEAVCALLQAAKLDCRVSPDIGTAVWTKYVFNCAFNVMTAAFSCDTGAIQRDSGRMADFAALLEEGCRVGRAWGANLPQDQPARHLHRLEKTDPSSESSLSRDFALGRPGEMSVFSGDLVAMAQEKGIPVPVTERYWAKLQSVAAGFSR